jgi:hypothetical protein
VISRFAVFAPLAVVGALVTLTGCATASAPDATFTSASAEASVSTQPATALPDAVPVTPGAQLVDSVKTVDSPGAKGWTAVTLTPSGTGATATTTVNKGSAGGRLGTKIIGSEKDGFVIAANRKVGAQTAWLNVNVTIPVPDLGQP